MTFIAILLGILIAFAVMFRLVKSGRLTVYMLTLDGVLIKAEPLFEAVAGYDFAYILTPTQQHWLLLVVTLLAGIARYRSTLRKTITREES